MAEHHLLAIDPGKMTGMALFSWKNGEEPILRWSGEVTEEQFAEIVRSQLAYPTMQVACESFKITVETAKKSQAPFSLELIGVLKQCMRDVGRSPSEIKMQTPADAKRMFGNPQLKKLGYWHVGGAGHALDAIRHGLLRLTTMGWKPRGLLD